MIHDADCVLQPIDPLNISFSADKCVRSPGTADQSPQSNKNQYLANFYMSNIVRDPSELFDQEQIYEKQTINNCNRIRLFSTNNDSGLKSQLNKFEQKDLNKNHHIYDEIYRPARVIVNNQFQLSKQRRSSSLNSSPNLNKNKNSHKYSSNIKAPANIGKFSLDFNYWKDHQNKNSKIDFLYSEFKKADFKVSEPLKYRNYQGVRNFQDYKLIVRENYTRKLNENNMVKQSPNKGYPQQDMDLTKIDNLIGRINNRLQISQKLIS